MSRYQLHHGDCLDVMATMEADSVDSIVTDPPYGLSSHKPGDIVACLSAWLAGEPYINGGGGFMGKTWDSWVPGPEVWRECLRLLKPGGHLLCFAGTRTADLMSIALRLAGFEIRDTVSWLYGSGFPKSHDVSKAIDKAAGAENIIGTKPDRWTGKGNSLNFSTDRPQINCKVTAPSTDAARQWDGWGTALKPAWEPVIVARKPMIGTVAQNVLAYGTGGINVDGCRVEAGGDKLGGGMVSKGRPKASEGWDRPWMHNSDVTEKKKIESAAKVAFAESQGRWPANVLHDGSDEVVGLFPESKSDGGTSPIGHNDIYGKYGPKPFFNYSDTGSAARFFYCAKSSKRDRDEGCEGLEELYKLRDDLTPEQRGYVTAELQRLGVA